jgi:hexosaminidase
MPAPPPHALIPMPTSVRLTPADTFRVDSTTAVVVDAGASAEAERIARYLAGLIGPPVRPEVGRTGAPGAGSIHLRLDPGLSSLGAEGYELTVARDRVTLVAGQPAGLFYAVQTLRQLMPWSVEHPGALGRRLVIPGARITDTPRYGWRGTMLDVSRHFLPAADVKRHIDLMALYKLNRLHLHLADDQGWRIEIKSWPKLATVGGATQVGGGAGGYYTQAEYADIVAYAASRFITIIPEIDTPAHINAAQVAYPELNCLPGVTPQAYTGTAVGFSALCVQRDTVYKWLNDVVREIAALTPGPWFHIGGDEVQKLTHEEYIRFIERAQEIVRSHGKQMVGWGEIAQAALHPSSVVQSWIPDSSRVHAARGGKIILSQARRMYLDMKYDSTTVLGLRWAAIISVRDSYAWEPSTYLPNVPESAIIGLEAPLWSETVVKREDFDFLAFPRLAAVAELAWTPSPLRAWEDFRVRLGAHGPRLQALGVNFYRSPDVPWQQERRVEPLRQ